MWANSHLVGKEAAGVIRIHAAANCAERSWSEGLLGGGLHGELYGPASAWGQEGPFLRRPGFPRAGQVTYPLWGAASAVERGGWLPIPRHGGESTSGLAQVCSALGTRPRSCGPGFTQQTGALTDHQHLPLAGLEAGGVHSRGTSRCGVW